MTQALSLAQKALYIPSPNPRVGCVIVRDEQVLAQGSTQAAGQAHAEVMALRQLKLQGLSAHGATVYVTLEPCSHTGKTPPCVEALIQARPQRVVIAHVDPNSKVSGRGVQALRQAGIEVEVGVCAKHALEVNPGFLYRALFGLPYVWLKIAASLDGYTATQTGQSQWITGEAARADGHHWRARSCLVLTGSGTVKADNPQMNVRAVQTDRQPLRAVIDGRLDIPLHSKLLQTPGLIIFTASQSADKVAAMTERGAKVVYLPAQTTQAQDTQRVDLPSVMRWLADHEINEVHVEAGGRLNQALWQAGCIDELLVYMAPILLGGGDAMLQVEPVLSLETVKRWTMLQASTVGTDARLRLRNPQRWQQLEAHIQMLNEQVLSA